MKKILVTILSLILVLSCFACADKPEANKEENPKCPERVAIDTFIRDSEGNEKCFWEDGRVEFHDTLNQDIQHEKSAKLSVNIDYDMCFYEFEWFLDFTIWFDVTFTYDKEMFEITENPEVESHFILKVLQPCSGEKFYVKILDKNGPDVLPESKGFPITITTEEE